jgi:hypothetical protein
MSFLDFLIKTRRQASSTEIQVAGGDTAVSNGSGPTLSSELIYPSDLFTPGTESYILFFVRDPVARGSKILKKMALYLPPTIKVAYGAEYQELEMTLIQYRDAFESASKQVKEFDMRNSELKYLGRKALANSFDSVLGTDFGKQVDQVTGKAVNPHMALLFKGMGFRKFQFDFQLMARNQKESESIRRIIQAFKEAMHPDVEGEGDRYWLFPDNFEIGLFSPADDYLFKISTCVLTGMSVDYAGSGIPSFFAANGAPVDVRMSLEFSELEILTKKRVREGY